MAGKIPDQILDISGGLETLTAMIFGFLDEGGNDSSGTENDSVFEGLEMEEDVDDGEDRNGNNDEQDKAFWEEKDQLLQATLRRTSTIEMKIRQATKDVLRELKLDGAGCSCRRESADGCRDCLRREISDRLRLAGFNCVICKSKWRSSPDIPKGEHTFLEILDNSDIKKGEMRVIIELNFRAEFELARANDGYKQLMTRLPDLYVGKADRLKALIKILCTAAKKCMEDKKMHMGPWRKKKYMEAKWFGPCERTSGPIRLTGLSGHLPKPKASMLTFDLVGNLTAFHPTAVKVL